MARWSTLALALLAAGRTPPVRTGPAAAAVDLVVAAATGMHGGVRGWDYDEDKPDSARGPVPVESTVPGFSYDVVSGVNYTLDLTRSPGERVTPLDIRHVLIDEVRRRGTVRPADYFHSNWKSVPSSAVTDAYGSIHRRMLNR